MEPAIPPKGTVRGNIKHYLQQNKDKLRGDILEVGSRVVINDAWWMNNRDLAPDANWIGIDCIDGDGVDVVADVEHLQFSDNSFDTVLCSEVMEHIKHPWIAINEMARVLKPGGHLIITTLFSFHVHGFPDDYWRFTQSCMMMLLEEAGLEIVDVSTDGEYDMILDDHGSGKVVVPMFNHVFAIGKKK